MKLGAEIFYSAQLAEVDPQPLCLTGTNLLLIEFPPAYHPRGAEDVLYQLTRRGFVPLIAHVERYAFVRENPNILCDFIEAGAYTQINASSLVMHKKQQKMLLHMIQRGLIHVLATDTHSLEKRPPKYRAAMELIEKKCGKDIARTLTRNANLLFAGASPVVSAVSYTHLDVYKRQHMKSATLPQRPHFALMKLTDVISFYHLQMPRWLFCDARYKTLSLEAKVAYTFLLNRFQLSRMNGWVNDAGEVYIVFTREELSREMGCLLYTSRCV